MNWKDAARKDEKIRDLRHNIRRNIDTIDQITKGQLPILKREQAINTLRNFNQKYESEIEKRIMEIKTGNLRTSASMTGSDAVNEDPPEAIPNLKGEDEETRLIRMQELYQKMPDLITRAYKTKFKPDFKISYQYIFRAALDHTFGKPYCLAVGKPAKKHMSLHNIKKVIKRMLEYTQDPAHLANDMLTSNAYRARPENVAKFTSTTDPILLSDEKIKEVGNLPKLGSNA